MTTLGTRLFGLASWKMALRNGALALCAASLSMGAARAAGSLEDLIAKGVEYNVQIRKDKGGAVIELFAGQKASLTADDYKTIGALHTLKKLYISPGAGRLDDNNVLALRQLDQLENFFANGSEMSDDAFKAFAGWKNLKSFGLDHWAWYATGHVGRKELLGPGLAHLAACPQLEHVRLGGCRVDNRVTEALAQIKSLQSVDLQHTFAVTDEGIAALQALPKLRAVKLSPQFSPRITDGSLVVLGKIKTLEEIEINETWLTYDKGFTHVKALPLTKITLNKVIATAADIDKLKADHPQATVVWTQPDEAITTKTKELFQKFWDKQGKTKS